MDDRPPLPIDFARLRAELGIPESFPPDVVEAARRAAERCPLPPEARAARQDYTIVPFVTIDPATSLDLDQAFYAQTTESGFIVLYAIADVGYFVDRDSPLELEAWRRGVTFYSPDRQTPLYPEPLSHGAASLLPDVERPAVLFSFELDEQANATLRTVERAVVVSRAKLSYESVSRHLDAERRSPGSGELAGEDWSESLAILERVGRLRQRLEADRGGVSLPISSQHVQKWTAAITGYRLSFRSQDDVEDWNAQISLMTGIAAASLMVEAGIGLLRVLDPPRPERLEALRLTAAALDVAWPDGMTYAAFIRSLDPTDPVHAALIFHAAGVMGAARYVAFDGAAPEGMAHAAIAAFYAHVTAPLRRLADRYVLDLLVDLCAGLRPSGSLSRTLQELPAVMQSADRLARNLESSIVDHAEAAILGPRVGDVFEATVIRVRDDRITVQIAEPPVRADVGIGSLFLDDTSGDGTAVAEDRSGVVNGHRRVSLGDRLELRLVSADPRAGRIHFEPV